MQLLNLRYLLCVSLLRRHSLVKQDLKHLLGHKTVDEACLPFGCVLLDKLENFIVKLNALIPVRFETSIRDHVYCLVLQLFEADCRRLVNLVRLSYCDAGLLQQSLKVERFSRTCCVDD